MTENELMTAAAAWFSITVALALGAFFIGRMIGHRNGEEAEHARRVARETSRMRFGAGGGNYRVPDGVGSVHVEYVTGAGNGASVARAIGEAKGKIHD